MSRCCRAGGGPAQDAALQHPAVHGLRVQAVAGHRDAVVRGLVAVPAPARAGDALPAAVPHRRGAPDRAGHGLPARQEHYTQAGSSTTLYLHNNANVEQNFESEFYIPGT